MTPREGHMARKIVMKHEGGRIETYPLSIVYLYADGSAEVVPYEREVPGVTYHDSTLTLTCISGRWLLSCS